ncbi:sulfatase-like hydrolase/transferase [Thalassotalea sp. SU-HH00458]|uniref:sulfatase-like hydrolase/transferase n=1 Tax=Thalassotalea sp. SU-HH00458 TaxID=3127657 RepID=UPI0031028817
MLKVKHLLKVSLRLCSLLALSYTANATENKNTSNQPNILFILADDMGKEWVSAYGAEDISTPNIDKLADKGIRFDNAWSHPQCTPSRVSLITGQYPHRNGWVNHWDTPRWGQAYLDWSQNQSVAKVMKNAGYATVAAGKWQVNDFRVEPQAMTKHGFDDYAMWTGYETGNEPSAERYWDPYIHTKKGSKTYKGQFGEDIFSDFILDFVDDNKAQPWFAYFAMNLPHSPYVTTPHSTKVESKMDKHKAMVEYADLILAKMVNRLEALDELENTIIIWTTDNGTNRSIKGRMNGRMVRGGKTKTTENGINSPFIVSGQGLVPKGVVSDTLIDFTDILPTFADLANTDIPKHYTLDGKSFADYLLAKTTDGKRSSIMSMGGRNEARVSENGVENKFVFRDRVIRDKRYKLYVKSSPEYGYEKLVDLHNDPEEKINLINSTKPEIVAAKKALIAFAKTQPAKDNDPKYRKRQALEWDKPVTVTSQKWKQ